MYLIFFHFNGGIHLKQQNQGDLNKMTINCTQKGSEFNASDLVLHKNTQYSPVLPPTFLFRIFNSSFPWGSRSWSDPAQPTVTHTGTNRLSALQNPAVVPEESGGCCCRNWSMALPLKVEGPNQVFFWKTVRFIPYLSKRTMPTQTQTQEVSTDTPCEANVAIQGTCVSRSNTHHHSTPPCSGSSIWIKFTHWVKLPQWNPHNYTAGTCSSLYAPSSSPGRLFLIQTLSLQHTQSRSRCSCAPHKCPPGMEFSALPSRFGIMFSIPSR